MAIIQQSRFSGLPSVGSGARIGQLIAGARQAGREKGIGEKFARLATPQNGEMPVEDRSQQIAQFAARYPKEFESRARAIGLIDQQRKNEAADFALQALAVPYEKRGDLFRQRAENLRAQGRDPGDTESLIDMTAQEQADALNAVQLVALDPQQRMRYAQGDTAALQTFKELTAGLSPEEQKRARRIELGLAPRATGSAIQTIAESGLAEEIGKTEAAIAQRKKFGELSASSRAKAIDEGFERVGKINQNLGTIDRAISLLQNGAKTGAIQKFLPSIRASSVELQNIRNRLALDVIGSVTFGALSQGELDLAKETALPEGLDEQELIDYLTRRKAAQEKLKNYFQEQIDFLDQGGSVAGFVRMKRREQESGAQVGGQQRTAPAPQQAAPQQATSVQRFRYNPETGKLEQ